MNNSVPTHFRISIMIHPLPTIVYPVMETLMQIYYTYTMHILPNSKGLVSIYLSTYLENPKERAYKFCTKRVTATFETTTLPY